MLRSARDAQGISPKTCPPCWMSYVRKKGRAENYWKKIHRQNPTYFPRQGSQVKRRDGMGQGVKVEE